MKTVATGRCDSCRKTHSWDGALITPPCPPRASWSAPRWVPVALLLGNLGMLAGVAWLIWWALG